MLDWDLLNFNNNFTTLSPTKIAKKSDKPLLVQILDLIPSALLNDVIRQHESDKHCHEYKTYDQLVSMMFGQLNKCHTLGISISSKFLKDIGLEQSPAKSTMSNSHAKRDWKVFEALYLGLLEHFSGLFRRRLESKIIEQIKGKHIKLVDASIMSLCLGYSPWQSSGQLKAVLRCM